jgi:hypothetical protein
MSAESRHQPEPEDEEQDDAQLDDPLRPQEEPDPLRLWYAELAVNIYEVYRQDRSVEESVSWAVADADEIYRIFLGMAEDIDDLKDKPDPACIQRQLPKGRRPTRKEKQEAIRACRKTK